MTSDHGGGRQRWAAVSAQRGPGGAEGVVVVFVAAGHVTPLGIDMLSLGCLRVSV